MFREAVRAIGIMLLSGCIGDEGDGPAANCGDYEPDNDDILAYTDEMGRPYGYIVEPRVTLWIWPGTHHPMAKDPDPDADLPSDLFGCWPDGSLAWEFSASTGEWACYIGGEIASCGTDAHGRTREPEDWSRLVEKTGKAIPVNVELWDEPK